MSYDIDHPLQRLPSGPPAPPPPVYGKPIVAWVMEVEQLKARIAELTRERDEARAEVERLRSGLGRLMRDQPREKPAPRP